jgi:Dolichyl-phosphate-mannose-protein mannosyltransferase
MESIPLGRGRKGRQGRVMEGVKRKAGKRPGKTADPGILSLLSRVYKWKYFAPAFALLFLAIMLFLALTFHKVGGFNVETDFYGGYGPEAKEFLKGNIVIDAYHGPFYPWIVSMFARFIGNVFTAGVIVSVVSASLTIFFVFRIVEAFYSAGVAFLATLFTAVNTNFIFYSYSACSDILFMMLLLMGVFLLIRSEEMSPLELVLSAVCMAMAYLVRYNGLVFLASVPLVLLLGLLRAKGIGKYTAAALWAAVFVCVIAPWAIYLKVHRGSFFYNANYQNLAFELFGGGKANWDNFWFEESKKYASYWDVISASPLLLMKTVLGNVFTHLYGDLTKLNSFLVGGMAVVGAIVVGISHPPKRMLGLLLVFLSFFCILLPVFYGERFSLFLLPVYSMFAAYMLKSIFEKYRSRKTVSILVTVLALVALVVTCADSYALNSVNIRTGATTMEAIGNAFHRKFGDEYDNQLIAARKPQIAYFLNMRLFTFPMVDSYDSLISVLRSNDVRFLYYGDYEASDRPQFSGLQGADTVHAGLRTVYVIREPSRVAAILYEVTK